ncbi:MAG: hypothetical protein ACI4O7_04735 [Aristaeellaceae bacterium]
MKRTVSFLLVLVLVLGCVSVATASVSNITVTQRDNGDTYVKWSGTGGPYQVLYTTDDWLLNYYDEDSIAGTSTLLGHLVPGGEYTIIVKDLSDGTSSRTDYSVPVSIYREFKTGNMFLKLTKDSFSLSDSRSNPLDTFEVRIYWPQLKYSREYKAKLVLETPLGISPTTIVWPSFTLENQYAYNYEIFSMYMDFLTDVEDAYGQIPTGKYTFKLYFDGDLYDYVSFTLYQ